ncbi:autotransporter outer membrane beta-barrel domain-containing protein [Campylobacter jejuni]|nr:autotransporter outer membrane beta-barrel domain-containing protein [Campylobacter jejuni]
MKLKLSFCALMAFGFSNYLFASAIDPNFYFQEYLDFANNKGKFQVGQIGFEILAKNPNQNISFNAPMIDFSTSNRGGKFQGEFTNIGQSYIVSASHMSTNSSGANQGDVKQGSILHFGGVANRIVSSSDDFTANKENLDFAVLKMSKINLNKSANLSKDLNLIEKNSIDGEDIYKYKDPFWSSCQDGSCDYTQGKGKLFDSSRYEYFVREGSGIVALGFEDPNKVPIKITGSNEINLGGFVSLANTAKDNKRFYLEIINYTNDKRNPFTSSSTPGDSGSGLYVYDKIDKKWYLIGVVSTSNCNPYFTEGYTCSKVDYALINQEKINEFQNSHRVNIAQGVYTLSTQGLMKEGRLVQGVSLISGANAGYVSYENYFVDKSKYDNRIKEMKNSKDLYFSQKGSIDLTQDVDLGASVLNFDKNSNWQITGDKWLIHGGIYADKGSSIEYNVKTKKDDFLYKMGEGELVITSQSENAGLRMGEGKVRLESEGLSFGEIYMNGGILELSKAQNLKSDTLYMNGGTLDLSGLQLSFNEFKANSNNVFITSSKQNSILNFNNTNNYLYHGNILSDKAITINANTDKALIFDGNIYNKEGVFKANNAKLSFQGHPLIHAYISDKNAQILTSHQENVLTKPVSFDQEDWENRVFVLKEIHLNSSSFYLGKNASLSVENFYANDSNLELGSKNLWIDEKDGENIIDKSNDYFYGQNPYTGVGNEMAFEQKLQNTQNAKIEKVYFSGNLNLDHSDATLQNIVFSGNIKGVDDAQKNLVIKDSLLESNIQMSNIQAEKSAIYGKVDAKKLSANNTIFKINVDFEKSKADYINSEESTQGVNNTLVLNFLNNPSKKEDLNILLAHLKDENKHLTKEFFTIPNVEQGFSIYTPNVVFSHNEENFAQWNLEKIDSKTKDEYFFTNDNTQAIAKAKSILAQATLGSMIEWNNMHKRMGELRNNPYESGVWLRTFGGGTSDEYNSGKYFEIQSGYDKLNEYSNFELYSGVMINYTNMNLSATDLSAKLNGYGIGQYFSLLFNEGFYSDFVLRYIYHQNEVNANFIPGNQGRLDDNDGSHNIILSAELGYRKTYDKFYLEPSLEFISGYVGAMDLKGDIASLKRSSYIPLVAKTAFFIGSQNQNLNFRTGLGLYADLIKTGDQILEDQASQRRYEGKKDQRMFINLGSDYKLNDKTRFSFEFEKTFFGDLNVDWSVNANLRYSF